MKWFKNKSTVAKWSFWRRLKSIVWTIILFSLLGGFFYGMEYVKNSIMVNTLPNADFLIFISCIIQFIIMFFLPIILARMYINHKEDDYASMGKLRFKMYIDRMQELYNNWYVEEKTINTSNNKDVVK